MTLQVMEKVFGSLQISKEFLLNEMAILLARQQLSEYLMEIEYICTVGQEK
ncbi:hypothetical protein MHK_004235 [Candidatus Magnetomorum sp. HK-1]|nr:hypothetical protein MHK_004235 [Candidatus Magnetomorum sp. HK-1]